MNSEKFSPDKKSPPAFTRRESHVAGQCGISRDTIREMRGRLLTQGEHWENVRNRVMLSEEGVQLIAQALRLGTEIAPQRRDAARIEDASRLLGPPGDPGLTHQREVILKAWHSPKNTMILEAYRRGTDPNIRANIVRVQVRSNVNFVKHMEVPARLVQEPDLYELTRPCPRDRGRW